MTEIAGSEGRHRKTCFNALYHFTPLLNLRRLIFGLSPFGWFTSIEDFPPYGDITFD
jgi:hypothetical protein